MLDRRGRDRGPVRGARRTLAWGLTGALVALLLGACGGTPPPDDEVQVGRDLTGADLWLSFEDSTTGVGTPVFDDAAGGPSTAEVTASGGGGVELVAGDDSDTAVQFPPACSPPDPCPRAMVEVAHTVALDPGDHDFEFGASVWLADDEVSTGSNLVQKGRFGTDGGQWKLQIDNVDGEPSCVMRSSSAGAEPVVVKSSVSVADSTWHRVSCRREGDDVWIDVDGQSETERGIDGSVTSDWPLRIGAPGVGDGDDQFHGRLDDVYLEIDRD